MKLLISFLLLFCFVAAGSAQERNIDKAEFDAMIAEGHSHKVKWKDEKYRMTVTTSSATIGRAQTNYSSKMILEFGPSMESRSINTSVFGPNPESRWEALRVGNLVYTRSGNKPWTRKEYAPPGPPKESEESPYQVLSSQPEYKSLGQGMLMDKQVQIFLKTERQTKVNQKTGETSETESKNKYWVDAKGMILKSDFMAETRGKTTTQTTVIMEWQLDPTITFTAPEMVP